MSRVGKKPVCIPNGINVSLDGSLINISKNNVKESYDVDKRLNVVIENNCIVFNPVAGARDVSAIWGTTQKNVSNIVNGIANGFSVDVELVGVGYKASVVGKQIVLELGYSHSIKHDIPSGIEVTCPKPTLITVRGHSKKDVGDLVAVLKGYRKVEPYKGKGVIRVGDFVYRKEGKKK